MEKICMSQKRIDEIRAICKEHGNDPGELINILHTVQGKLGYLPKEVQELIAMELGIPAAKVYGVVTFYSFFTMKPKGKYPISVCMGTACYVRGREGARRIQAPTGHRGGRNDRRRPLRSDSLRCGCLRSRLVVMVGQKVFGRLTQSSVKGIIDEFVNLEREA
ncbi:MAG: NAD(P)H-dependent oxidoreductase subunit E [Alistipes inops]